MREDAGARAMREETEESKKVARLGGKKYYAVFERISYEAEETLNANPPLLAMWKLE